MGLELRLKKGSCGRRCYRRKQQDIGEPEHRYNDEDDMFSGAESHSRSTFSTVKQKEMRPNLSVEFLWRISLTILLVSAITSFSTAAFHKRNSSPIFNATVGEGNEEEFSMESEVHHRLIASQSQFIGYRSLEQQPVCN
uniref:Uncharacterized protein n=1 Tax=Salix viminalis TaxID=40686 RepID=A0A6N2N2R6_SALVM